MHRPTPRYTATVNTTEQEATLAEAQQLAQELDLSGTAQKLMAAMQGTDARLTGLKRRFKK